MAYKSAKYYDCVAYREAIDAQLLKENKHTKIMNERTYDFRIPIKETR